MALKKRAAFAAIAASAMVLALGACSSGGDASGGGATGGGDSSAAGGGQRTLTVAAWSMDQTPEFQALFDAFEAANPDVKIKPVDILAADYPDKVTTMLAGGDSTDVITMKQLLDYTKYYRAGQLQDLTDIVNGLDYKDKLSGLDGYEVDGKYAAIPYRQDFWVLYYNKKIFDDAGVDYPDNLTWDQYADLACKLTSGDGDSKVWGTYHHTWRSVIQAMSAAQTGGDLLGGKYDFFKPQYEMALKVQDQGCAMKFGDAKQSQADYRSIFENQQTAMLPMGSWYISGIMQAIKDGSSTVDWGIAPMPQIKSGSEVTTFGSPTAFAVNKNAKNSEDAKKFVEFAASMEGAKTIAAVGVVPSYSDQDVTDAYFALDGMAQDDLSKKAFEPDTVNLEMPPAPFSSDIDTILTEEHEYIMSGQNSIDDGIAAMNDRVQNDVLSAQ